MHKKPLAYLALLVGAVMGAFLAHMGSPALASRNTSGVNSLPSGNPVVSGTTITSANENAFRADVSTELTNSLDRQGRGAMLAPLQLDNGTVAAPSLTFGTDADTGLYRVAANNPAIAAGGVKVFECLATGCTFPLLSTTTGLLTSAAGHTVTQSTTNTAAITATGNGSGNGITATGGLTGKGGAFTGGATSGTGVTANGGATGGIGIEAVGTGSLSAITGVGAGVGWGAILVGGATGGGAAVTAGGSPTADTNTRYALEATGGHIKLSGGNPAATTGFTNIAAPMNLIKAWAKITVTNGVPAITSGFNVASTSIDSGTGIGRVRVTIANDMAGTTYGSIVSGYSTLATARYQSDSDNAGYVTVSYYDNTAEVALNGGAVNVNFTVLVLGAQ